MTIITQPITEKKLSKQQKEPLVGDAESGVGETVVSHAVGPQDAEAGAARSPLMVTLMQNRGRRVSSLTTVCVFLTALLVFATGIIGGVYLYRQFTQYRLRHFRGWCSIPYAEHQQLQLQREMDADLSQMDRAVNELLQSMSQGVHQKSHESESEENAIRPSFDTFFDQEFDIDIEYEEYERIEVPDFSHGRRGRFIHDFSVNKTGIIDLEAGRCFVMSLNRSMVLPPHSLFDLVAKMRSGYYDVDTEIVREAFRVLTPAVTDMKTIGYYIGRECANLPTYRLEKVASPVFKRSIDPKVKTVFAEFAGRKISEIEIVNLHNAPGNK